MNPDPMSFRRAVAEEILDTIYFGNLDSIKGAKGRKFSKVKTGQKDAYMRTATVRSLCIPLTALKWCLGSEAPNGRTVSDPHMTQRSFCAELS